MVSGPAIGRPEHHQASVIRLSTESVLAEGKPLVNVDETEPVPATLLGGYFLTKVAAERMALAKTDSFSVALDYRYPRAP